MNNKIDIGFDLIQYYSKNEFYMEIGSKQIPITREQFEVLSDFVRDYHDLVVENRKLEEYSYEV
jgi:hypothetical protein